MKQNKALLLIVVLSGLLPLLAACSSSPKPSNTEGFPLTVKDSYDRSVTIARLPESIVSLAPSNTEILFALGLGDRVIGVTEVCDYPEEAKQIEKMGGFQGPNMEKIIAAQPDLVLADPLTTKEVVQQLQDSGLAVLAIRSDNIEHLFENIDLVGQATGTTSQAEQLVSSLRTRLEAVTEQINTVPEGDRVRVFYEVWHDELMSCGPNTFLSSIIQSAGGVSVTADASSDWPKVNLEDLIMKNPQVIILGHTGQTPEEAGARSAWQTMDAVKNKRIYALNPDIWNRPGPRVLDAVEELAVLLYPDLFNK